MIDWEAVGLLLNSSKKKYIKKIVEYAGCLHLNPKSVPLTLSTPISQQISADLQIPHADTHKLVQSLANLVGRARECSFDREKLEQLLQGRVDEALSTVLLDMLLRVQSGILKSAEDSLSGGEALLSFDWTLDMEVANQSNQISTPVVELELMTGQGGQATGHRIEMGGSQFEVFLGNLRKIKEQLGQLVGREQ